MGVAVKPNEGTRIGLVLVLDYDERSALANLLSGLEGKEYSPINPKLIPPNYLDNLHDIRHAAFGY